MKRRTARTLPWDSLVAAARVPVHYDRHLAPTRFDYARYFDVAISTIDRWREDGIPLYQADRIAITKLGTHPGVIWREWFEDACEPVP